MFGLFWFNQMLDQKIKKEKQKSTSGSTSIFSNSIQIIAIYFLNFFLFPQKFSCFPRIYGESQNRFCTPFDLLCAISLQQVFEIDLAKQYLGTVCQSNQVNNVFIDKTGCLFILVFLLRALIITGQTRSADQSGQIGFARESFGNRNAKGSLAAAEFLKDVIIPIAQNLCIGVSY